MDWITLLSGLVFSQSVRGDIYESSPVGGLQNRQIVCIADGLWC